MFLRRTWLPLSILSLVACTSDGGGSVEPDDGFDRRALVTSVGEHVILPTYERAADEADSLNTAVVSYASAVQQGSDAAGPLSTARQSFRTAFVQWQWVEAMQLGPAGRSSVFEGGRGLRDRVYSWPTANACRVDQIVYSQDYAASDFFDRELVNAFGFDALEYLLHAPGTENACALSVPLNSEGQWASLSAAEIERRRAEYAARLAGQLASEIRGLYDRWRPDGGNFLADLQRAGERDSVYGTAQEAIDQLFAAMFYVEREVKDLKLAAPLGVSGACTSSTVCPDLVESPHADLALDAVRANLAAFEALFLGQLADDGEERVGFDDFLGALGADALRDQMVLDIAEARAALDSVPVPMTEALSGSTAQVLSGYEALRDVTTALKTQFVSVLSLRVPNEGAGDND